MFIEVEGKEEYIVHLALIHFVDSRLVCYSALRIFSTHFCYKGPTKLDEMKKLFVSLVNESFGQCVCSVRVHSCCSSRHLLH
jgi:hypothetical protein